MMLYEKLSDQQIQITHYAAGDMYTVVQNIKLICPLLSLKLGSFDYLAV